MTLRKVDLGRVQATRAALQVMEIAGDDVWVYIDRHRRKLSEIDASSLEPGSQMLSTYRLKNGVQIGIMTEFGSGTIVFLPGSESSLSVTM